MTAVSILGVILVTALITYSGVREGAFVSVCALARDTLAFMCAMTLCQPAAAALGRLFMAPYPWPDYFVGVSFAGLFGGTAALLRWLKVRFAFPGVQCSVVVERAAGGCFGFANAVVLTGTVLILVSLFPFAKYLPGDAGRIAMQGTPTDTGAVMLRFYSLASKRMAGARKFLLLDERLTLDANGNGRCDPGEDEYEDANANGQWDRGWLWQYHNYADIRPEHLKPLNLPDALDAPDGQAIR
jgi:hypothetical protein